MAEPEPLLWNGQPLVEWVAKLNHPEADQRWQAVDAICHIASPADSIPLLLEAMSDRYWRARALAIHALYDMTFEDQHQPLVCQAIPNLIRAIKDESSVVRLNAVYTLEQLGPKASAAVQALQDAVEQGDEHLGQAAKDALEQILGNKRSSL